MIGVFFLLIMKFLFNIFYGGYNTYVRLFTTELAETLISGNFRSIDPGPARSGPAFFRKKTPEIHGHLAAISANEASSASLRAFPGYHLAGALQLYRTVRKTLSVI